MSNAQITQLIEETLQAGWVSTQIGWANVENRDQTIAGSPLLSEGTNSYIDFSVDFTGSSAIEIPLGYIRYHGYINVDIYTKEGVGTRSAEGIVDDLNDLFQYRTFLDGTLCVRTHEYLDTGTFTILQGWLTKICQWPFSADIRRAP